MKLKSDLINFINDNRNNIHNADDLINQLEVEIKQHKYIKEVRVNILKIISDYKQDYNWDFTLIDLNNYLFN